MSPLKSIFLEYYRCVWLGVVRVSHVTMCHMSHSVINVTWIWNKWMNFSHHVSLKNEKS
jgi:hypothetical protein